MGMFDYVSCEYELPFPKTQNLQYQTKDTPEPLFLENYRITKEGRMLVETYRIEDRSNKDSEGIERLAGCMTRIPTGWQDTNFQGTVAFYTDYDNGKEHLWIEYEAEFKDGQIVKVDVLEHRPFA